jgi:hypothetical protein
MNRTRENLVFRTNVWWSCQLIVLISLLLSGCVAQVTDRAERVMTWAENTAFIVVSACADSPHEQEATEFAAACYVAVSNAWALLGAFETVSEDAGGYTRGRDLAQQKGDVAAANALAQLESDAAALREKYRTELEAALGAVMSATTKADTLAQQCGAPPLAVRMPGFAQTFTDVHGTSK